MARIHAQALTGGDAHLEAQTFVRAGPRLVAITRGAMGCYLATPEGSVEVSGYSVDAVDTTGAGDGFVAGLLTRVIQAGTVELGLDELLRADEWP